QKGPLLSCGTCSWTETATFRQTFSLFESRRKIRRQDLLGLTTTALWAEAEITNHWTRALNAFPRPRMQSPRSGRWPRFAEIYGGHTTMLHNPKCRCDYPLASIRLHHADIFQGHQANLFQPRLDL
ncbi:unnamed protein product, partial [Prunus brigantina]